MTTAFEAKVSKKHGGSTIILNLLILSEKSRFACGPPRLNTPTDGTHPVFLPGEHVLGDVDFPPYPPTETEPEPVNTSAPNDTEPTSRVKQQGDQGDHQEVRTNSNAADVEAASKAPTKKMAIMMITPPPDVRGYRIVNEDGSEHKPDETWHILHGNGAHHQELRAPLPFSTV